MDEEQCKHDWDKTSRALEAKSGPPVDAWEALKGQIRRAQALQREINDIIAGRQAPPHVEGK